MIWQLYRQRCKTLLFKIILLTLAFMGSNKVIASAAPWPGEVTTNEDGNFYYWRGYFYWYGNDKNKTEMNDSWYNPPRKPNTLYYSDWDDIQLHNASENDGKDEFGFTSYDAYWRDGNEKRPFRVYNKNHDYEKAVVASYKRKKTFPEYKEITVKADKARDQYIEENNDKKIYWIKPTTATINVQTKQSWLGTRGVVLNDYITENGFDIKNEKGAKYEFKNNRESVVNKVISKPDFSILKQQTVPIKNKKNLNEVISTNFYMKFNRDGADYVMRESAKSKNGKSIGFGNNTTLKIDGTGPIYDTATIVNNESDSDKLKASKVTNGFECTISGLRDIRGGNKAGVGIDFYSESPSTYLELVKLSGDKKTVRVVDGSNSGNGKVNIKYSIDFRYGELEKYFSNYYGMIQVRFISIDKLGNKSTKDVAKLEKIKPSPVNGKLSVAKFDHKESNSVYWVKTESPFVIYTEGYFDRSFFDSVYPKEVYPTQTDALLLRDNNKANKFYIQTANLTGNSYESGAEDDFLSGGWSIDKSKVDKEVREVSQEKAEKLSNNNKLFLRTLHVLQASQKADKKSYRLYNRTGYIDNTYGNLGEEYFSDNTDSGLWIKVDGTSPKGNAYVNFDTSSGNLSIKTSAITDTGGSGVDKVYVKFYDEENDYSMRGEDKAEYNYEWNNDEKSNLLELQNDNETWKMDLNAAEKFKFNKLGVIIFAKDNVGNVTKLCNKVVDLFTLSARLVPFNKQDSAVDIPTLKQGQAGLLIIKTTGFAEQLVIDFPERLNVVKDYIKDSDGKQLNYVADENYSISVELDKNKYAATTNIEFIVDLNAENGEYTIPVTAQKGENSSLNVDLKLKVSDNILDGVRTRLR